MLSYLVTVRPFCNRLAITTNFPLTTPQHWSSQYLFSTTNGPLSLGATLFTHSGRTYTSEEVLAERCEPLLCMYRAMYNSNPFISSSDVFLILQSAEGRSYIIKQVIPGEYKYQQALQKPLFSCPILRTMVDGLPSP